MKTKEQLIKLIEEFRFMALCGDSQKGDSETLAEQIYQPNTQEFKCKICGDTGRGKPTLGEPDGAEGKCDCVTNKLSAEQFYNQKSIDLNYKDFEHYIDCREYDVLQKEIIEWTEQYTIYKNHERTNI